MGPVRMILLIHRLLMISGYRLCLTFMIPGTYLIEELLIITLRLI